MTKDKNELMRRWMKLYMNLMILKSINPHEAKLLQEMKDKLVEWHQIMMDFFDTLGADPEAGA